MGENAANIETGHQMTPAEWNLDCQLYMVLISSAHCPCTVYRGSKAYQEEVVEQTTYLLLRIY